MCRTNDGHQGGNDEVGYQVLTQCKAQASRAADATAVRHLLLKREPVVVHHTDDLMLGIRGGIHKKVLTSFCHNARKV